MKTNTITHLAFAAAAIALPAGSSAQDGPDLPPDRQPDFRPDGIICKPVRTDEGIRLRCVGNDIYNRTGRGQGVRGEATLRRPANYGYKLQNDGAETDAFLVRGTRGNRFFRVGYFANGNNITGRITGPGVRTGAIEPGREIAHPVRIVVKANPRAFRKAGKRARKHILTAVTAVSRGGGNPPVVDRVLAGTRLVRARPNDSGGDESDRADRKPGDRRPSDRKPGDRRGGGNDEA